MKAPWAVFGILPVVAIIAVGWLVAMTMMKLMWPVRTMVPTDMPGGYQALIGAASIFTGYILGPLLVAACIAGAAPAAGFGLGLGKPCPDCAVQRFLRLPRAQHPT